MMCTIDDEVQLDLYVTVQETIPIYIMSDNNKRRRIDTWSPALEKLKELNIGFFSNISIGKEANVQLLNSDSDSDSDNGSNNGSPDELGNVETDDEIEDIHATISPKKKVKNQKDKRRKKAYEKAKAVAEKIIIENNLPLKLLYRNYLSVLHDVQFVPGPYKKKKILYWNCQQCEAKISFSKFYDGEQELVYILTNFKSHNNVCMNEIVNGTESRFPIPSKEIYHTRYCKASYRTSP